ncbi:MAG: NAD(+) synthase [Bacillota bacterium]
MQQLADRLVTWLRERVAAAGCEGLVLGLSGGIDSAVCAGLCKRACPDSILGVIMPCFSNPQDAAHAQMVADCFAIPTVTVVLDDVFELLVRKLCAKEYDPYEPCLPVANIKPRLRMTTLYYFANERNALVVGTGNRSEIMVGYYTKYGDGGADLLPIGNLVKGQVKELARHLGVPREIIDKPPSAGLWLGQDDEEELGVTYEELDRYLLTGQLPAGKEKIIKDLIDRSQHKREMPLIPPF